MKRKNGGLSTCANYEPSKRLEQDVKIINGVPQIIYKIPLFNALEEGLDGIEIPQILDRIIIGPSEYASSSSGSICVLA